MVGVLLASGSLVLWTTKRSRRTASGALMVAAGTAIDGTGDLHRLGRSRVIAPVGFGRGRAGVATRRIRRGVEANDEGRTVRRSYRLWLAASRFPTPETMRPATSQRARTNDEHHGQGLQRWHHLRRVRVPEHPAHRSPSPDGQCGQGRAPARRASMASGRSPVRMPSGAQPRTAAPRLSAPRQACGSRLNATRRADPSRNRPAEGPVPGGRTGVEREFGRLKHEWAMLRFGSLALSGWHCTSI